MSTNSSKTTVLSNTLPAPPLAPINVYAVIALIAALIGLFPIAIVFGALAFTRPAGRGLAVASLILGILEVAAILLAYLGVASVFTGDSADSATPPVNTANVSTQAVTPTSSAVLPDRTKAYNETPTPTITTEATPTVAIGDYCTDRNAQAVTADGSTAYCARRAGTDAYLWASSPGIIPNPDLSQQPTSPASGADTPVTGSPCSVSELGQIRQSVSGQRVKCGYTGEDSVLWLALN